MTRFAGAVVLVSGAASGIGLATAQAFAREAATVILLDRAEDRLDQALEDLAGGRARHHAVRADVTQEADWQRVAGFVADRFGRLDVLFNNAGYGAFRSIAETSYETWRQVLAVNLDSVFLATKYLLPLLARSEAGAIVNMSSMRGIVAGPNTGSYCAAKAGVRLFTKVTALECAEAGYKVQVNSIHPGHVETPLTARAYADPKTARTFLSHTPLGRFAAADEIARAVLFLASADASYMTGAELVVDGGVTAQ